MKKILILLLLQLCTIKCFAQTYHFDYVLTYKYTSVKKTGQEQTKVFLINTKDNSYYAVAKEKSNGYEIEFVHWDNWHARDTVSKDNFNTGKITLNCTGVYMTSNPYKYQTKHYGFSTPKDTVFQNKTRTSYFIEILNPKRKKRRKAGRTLYITDTNKNWLPFFTHPTIYEEWKEEHSIPNGMVEAFYFLDYQNKLADINLLADHQPINFSITIPDCPPKIITRTITTSSRY